MAGRLRTFRESDCELTFPADLNSNNSFDSGASLMPTFQNEWSMDPMSTFTAINNHSFAAGSTRTVSPKDIFADPFGLDSLGSAPPSAAFTNLTSPDLNDSPFIDPYDCSPAFHGDSLSSEWPSLFPDEESRVIETVRTAAPVPLPMERTISNQSMERSSSSSNGSPYILNGSFGRKSSITNSPVTNGISKSRRRKGPLPAIVPDPQDKIAYKRARNTLAARESRQRKFAHVEDLERRNSELEAEIEKWKNIALAHGYSES
ncbi:cross-pathway control protein 1 [Dothidotthia symphoricarpi CBS 119687]|uniref:Cross-pathway control protein 1 n=1 Tax=Dothidotthia symphoricarpi CBS 119687 TaxID=1392245 RepID=A0A6A6AHZ1_9PLEO|nr:cross-pathway control protein 1 [Dothidotthia symphoricarpi CBS 119687]KAF2131420.1 cross-pathway control protein 1 [Dothidotthia symphoricarpi CBS 119687]